MRYGSTAAQTVASPGGDPAVAAGLDPVTNSSGCKAFAAEHEPGTASYSSVSRGFTLIGLPTVLIRIRLQGRSGNDAQLAARLWDVAPGGRQVLITRGDYRLQNLLPSSRIVFQLHGNGYHVARGHTVLLQLLGSDSPYFRASNGAFTVTITRARVVLPTLERPNGGQVLSPRIQPLARAGLFRSVTTQGVPVRGNPWRF